MNIRRLMKSYELLELVKDVVKFQEESLNDEVRNVIGFYNVKTNLINIEHKNRNLILEVIVPESEYNLFRGEGKKEIEMLENHFNAEFVRSMSFVNLDGTHLRFIYEILE